ncbi:hypothetical protein [Nonomuraea zeae]|uniref:Uncharacterized protein n=1 Tax=Nonomuraea zeae TaxID=1642303 RepID=A0A5S4GGP2_9ACTN|nr:hypothetical protein [Nonomuraea zeae]TMR31674.1 hypothetical protein ETD85_25175 [Nonomuraea zeae]
MNIADLARVRDEDLAGDPVGQPSGAGARALMESIMAEEPPPARRPAGLTLRRGLGLGALAAGLAAALIVAVPIVGPVTEYANAAVSVKSGADFIDVVINDPEAEAEAFTEAFRAVGLDAEVKKVPVDPHHAGELIGPATPGEFPPGAGVTISYSGDCASAWCGKITMPVRYTGKIIFGIGRPAEPGERYARSVQLIPMPPPGTPDAFEGNQGYDGYHRPVSEVRAEMERRGMRISYVLAWFQPDGSGNGYRVDAARIKDDWLIESGRQVASDAVELTVAAPAEVPADSVPRAELPLPRGWWED